MTETSDLCYLRKSRMVQCTLICLLGHPVPKKYHEKLPISRSLDEPPEKFVCKTTQSLYPQNAVT